MLFSLTTPPLNSVANKQKNILTNNKYCLWCCWFRFLKTTFKFTVQGFFSVVLLTMIDYNTFPFAPMDLYQLLLPIITYCWFFHSCLFPLLQLVWCFLFATLFLSFYSKYLVILLCCLLLWLYVSLMSPIKAYCCCWCKIILSLLSLI